jgi:hypothetical protein
MLEIVPSVIGLIVDQMLGVTCLRRTNELKTSRIRAMWTAVSSPIIRSLLESTRLAF